MTDLSNQPSLTPAPRRGANVNSTVYPTTLQARLRQIALHGTATFLFCCAVALALHLSTGRRYDVQLAYSVGTGMSCWFLIEIGRFFWCRDTDGSWPPGWRGPLLIAGSIAISFIGGTMLGDLYIGQSSWRWFEANPTDFRASLVLTVVAGVVATSTFYFIGKGNALKASVALAERDAAEAKLKLLETQIEPHMLFNTLANLRALIKTDPTAAVTMLDRLNDYLRATLAASRATLHPLQTEFDRLRDYLELMAVRMGPRLQVTLDLPPELAQCKVPTLLLQPLVENSIKHGLEPHIAGGSITVRARQEDTKHGTRLVLDVIDTGAGLADQPPANTQSTGFGLAQVRERLATAYGSAASLTLAAYPPQGTRVTISLPLQP